MKTFSEVTEAKIKAYLEVFIENLVDKYKGRKIISFDSSDEYLQRKSKDGRLKPFHAAILPTEFMRLNEFERGISTSLGTTFEECAKLIALDHHEDAQRGYQIEERVSLSAIDEIEHQYERFLTSVENTKDILNFDKIISDILAKRKSKNPERRTARADLYIKTKNGVEFFFEIKSPKPNKGQCEEVFKRILKFHLLKGANRPEVQAYFAMAYNPFGPAREDYIWSIPKKYLPFEDAVVIGHEFWEIIGGKDTNSELLQIYRQVGKEKGKYIFDSLAFGF